MAEYIIGIADDSTQDIDRLHREYAVNGMIFRCKDCQFYDVRCVLHNVYTNDDNFCSWAVKRIYEHRSTKSGHGKGRI